MYEATQQDARHTNALQGANAQRELEVHKWIGELRTETNAALQAVLELRERLVNVMRTEPEAVEKEGTPRPILVPVAGSLRELCDKARETVQVTQDVLSRLEV